METGKNLKEDGCPKSRTSLLYTDFFEYFHFRTYFITTVVAVTVLYITFGVSGYLSYGPETEEIITLNLPHPEAGDGINFAIIVKLCLCFSLFFTYPIMMFPITALLDDRLLGPKNTSYAYAVGIRLGLVILTGLVVSVVPHFADLMALVGASCCTVLAFIMPALCHLKLFGEELSQKDRALDYSLVGVGVVGAIVGTLDALNNIMK